MSRRHIIRIFASVDALVGWFEKLTIGLSILMMALNIVLNVLSRALFSHSFYFSEEVNEILMVAITFVGLGYVTREGLHIRMSALYDRIPERPRRWLTIFISITTAAAMFFLAYYAFHYVQKVAGRGRVTPAMQIPLWTIYVCVVFGFVIAGIQYLLSVYANIRRAEGVWISTKKNDEYDDAENFEIRE